ncbi:MAG: glutamate-5-semialdehyde dehydrogenase, partial [Alphaproteobacteria bacterium]|nr:glutamate-5-semialdehyde dehydrogenase [Alphaproteobacteria bacterium]
RILWEQTRPNGLKIQRIACPIGLLGMIYESRPNVTVDASVLCLKSHNAVMLRGGSECLHSSLILHKIIQQALKDNGLPEASVSMIPISDRAAVGAMLKAAEYIDVMIPRGGSGLIQRVMDEARMPVFGHLNGICHVYIHPTAKPDIAREVTLNAKMRRTGICGATETLLLDKGLDPTIVKDVLTTLLDAGCSIVGDAQIQDIDNRIMPATDEDWVTEYLDAKLSCKFVDSVKDAVNHINTYGSHHTDSILTEDKDAAAYFLKNVDSGIVLHNASTQYADGGEFGMGAEIGIATGKMHARGPVGVEQLCTYKYNVHGNGQTRPR